MKKIVVMILMVLSTTFIFASSADLIEKINIKVENLKQELNGELGKNGMNYQIAGSFSVDGESIKIEAYAVPNIGESLVSRLSITEIRDRNNLENLIKRESAIPKSETPSNTRGILETLAMLTAVTMLGFIFNKMYTRRKEKEIVESAKAESENREDKKAA